ncbi:uncharacterized protein K444DRAFT_624586 [Hyaloscypha bicolor E]|uniref:Uncharacterized protein n=1 Tax=Hyaloscypha bicolor E TaxID=1095630 RepID=A0A2J6TSS7_9HELO|nr:uncharacterized protein K444DRAFT_624586 [Hyaloscypha bicolor E]PMD66071.1 hypothetical protein K444DRAFT_624586 [Hyaloscypha bicolor E]
MQPVSGKEKYCRSYVPSYESGTYEGRMGNPGMLQRFYRDSAALAAVVAATRHHILRFPTPLTLWPSDPCRCLFNHLTFSGLNFFVKATITFSENVQACKEGFNGRAVVLEPFISLTGVVSVAGTWEIHETTDNLLDSRRLAAFGTKEDVSSIT